MADRIFNVVCICGSLRKASYNRMVMNALPALAPSNMKLSEAPQFAEFPLYNADMQDSSGIPRAVQTLAEAIRAADGVIFNSPEYNFSMPGGLKNAIDWVSRVPNQPFAGKPVALQSAANGVLGGGRMQYDLRRSMIFLDAMTLNKPEIFIGNCSQKIDTKTGQITDQQAVDESKRCMSCGMCFECDNCVIYCPQTAVKRTPKSEATMGRYVYTDYDLCIGCHICADVCPTGYIKMGLGDH